MNEEPHTLQYKVVEKALLEQDFLREEINSVLNNNNLALSREDIQYHSVNVLSRGTISGDLQKRIIVEFGISLNGEEDREIIKMKRSIGKMLSRIGLAEENSRDFYLEYFSLRPYNQ
jgi:hypothetical protein